jgi:predicted HicB family RNase H-like nuclease
MQGFSGIRGNKAKYVGCAIQEAKTMRAMTYRGYAARIEYSDEEGCFVGHTEVHARAAMMAEARGKSLNQWAADVLADAS